MRNVLTVWGALTARQKATLFVGSLALFLVFGAIVSMALKPSMSLLYANLEDRSAGEVVAALEQEGVAFKVMGGAIYVDDARRDELRLTLAGKGLPANAIEGYEILDGLSGFGTTAQMFDAAYWRAKEGELARTILSSRDISSARVHIAQIDNNPFQTQQEGSASVFLVTNSGTVSPELAQALQFLVASAVPRLSPANVSILDSTGHLINAETEGDATVGAQELVGELRQRVQRLVEARVGRGNAVVEVSVDRTKDTELILETRFDPESRVAISTETEESTRQTEDGAQALSVASNLPDGDAANAAGASSQNSETRERTNFEVSETRREITRGPGAIQRLTVAVLVNGTQIETEDGLTSFEPLPQSDMDDLQALVASAVGFDEERGDVITIRSMGFEILESAGSQASILPWYHSILDVAQLSKMALLAVVASIIGLFVVRPLMMPRTELATDLLPGPTQLETAEVLPDSGEFSLPDGTVISNENVGEQSNTSEPNVAATDDPVERLRNIIDARKDDTVEVLQSWLETPERV